MQRDESYLFDIVEAADALASYLAGVSRSDFEGDEILRSALQYKLMVIGEAASRLGTNLKERHPEIDWRGIIGFRNVLVHVYRQVDWSVVWVAATKEAPALRIQVERILSKEFPDAMSEE